MLRIPGRIDVSDEEIMADFHLGKESAMRLIHLRYILVLLRFAQYLVTNRQDAEDIASDAFRVLWERKEEFPTMHKVRQFLILHVRNRCFNELRNRQNRERVHEAILYSSTTLENTILDSLIQANTLQLIVDTIQTLPDKQRKVFVALFLEGKTSKEVAQELRISVDAVYRNKALAADKLRTLLKMDELFFFILPHCIENDSFGPAFSKNFIKRGFLMSVFVRSGVLCIERILLRKLEAPVWSMNNTSRRSF